MLVKGTKSQQGFYPYAGNPETQASQQLENHRQLRNAISVKNIIKAQPADDGKFTLPNPYQQAQSTGLLNSVQKKVDALKVGSRNNSRNHVIYPTQVESISLQGFSSIQPNGANTAFGGFAQTQYGAKNFQYASTMPKARQT